MPKRPTPSLAVDAVIFLGNSRNIVMIRRKNPPYGWALPGGFCEVGEHCQIAAKREAKEETGLDVKVLTQLHTYSNPSRDPRGHVVSVVYICQAPEDAIPVGADDAKEARIFDIDTLLISDGKYQTDTNETPVFDHTTILYDARRWLDKGFSPYFLG